MARKKDVRIGQYVVITTKTRRWLVLHGILRAVRGEHEDIVELENVRCAVYYSAATRSHMGLATTGPAAGSRISTAVEHATVSGVETIMVCTEAATAMWQREEWA